jgi:hypothetical protein
MASFITRFCVLDTLRFRSFPEPEVCNRTANPADESRSVSEVDKPVEDDRAIRSTVQVREGQKEARSRDRGPGHTILGTRFENTRRISGDGEGV